MVIVGSGESVAYDQEAVDQWFAGDPPPRPERVRLPYTERGGAWVQGATMLQGSSATWPFARIVVERGSVSVHCLGNSYVFRPGRSVSIHSQLGLFSRGIRIESDDGSEPLTVTFWTFSYPRLHSAIKHAGF